MMATSEMGIMSQLIYFLMIQIVIHKGVCVIYVQVFKLKLIKKEY